MRKPVGIVSAFLLACFGASAQLYNISTVAGGAPPPTGVPAISAPLGTPGAVATDSTGNVYFISFNCVFKIDSTGVLTRVAGNSHLGFSGDNGPAAAAQLNNPGGLAVDSSVNIYIADSGNNRVRKVSSSGVITTIAGTGTPGYSGDNGAASAAALNNPQGAAVDTAGNLYIADVGNNVVRKIGNTGIISTFAGNGTPGISGDGNVPTAAQLNQPMGVAVDAGGSLYIADSNNQRLRVVRGGIISTIAGNGSVGSSGDGGPPNLAQFNFPTAVAVDPSGIIYITDFNNARVRKIANNIISTVAGAGTGSVGVPTGIATDANGNLYIADSNNSHILKFPAAGGFSTIAGNGSRYYLGDGGPAANAQLVLPQGVAVDINGIYVADRGEGAVRKILSNGNITTLANATGPAGVAVDTSGNYYIADASGNRILKIPAGGSLITLAGTGTPGFSGDGGAAIFAQFNQPGGVAVDGAGNLYVADTGNNRIRKITPGGIITTWAGTTVAGFSGDNGLSTTAQLNQPASLTSDSAGNVYIADSGNNRVRMISTSGIITTVAGNGSPVSSSTGDGGPATAAFITSPHGVALDSHNNLYITDSSARVRKVSTAGTITTIAGNGSQGYSGDGGPALSAQLNQPWGVTVDGSGYLYVTDVGEQAVRCLAPVAPSSPLSITTTSPLPSGTVGVPYAGTLAAAGGTPPYSWSIAFGNLPAGLSFSSTGSITGIPAVAGSALVQFQVTDSASATAMATLGINILPSTPAGLTITTSPTMVPAAVGTSYSQTLTAAAGNAPYTWMLVSGALPLGLTLSPSGIIAGTPVSAGTATFTVRVNDISSAIATQTFTLTVISIATLSPAGVLGHIAVGGGWATKVYLTNVSTAPVAVSLTFRADDGTALSLPLNVSQQGTTQVVPTSSLNAVLNPNTTLLIDCGSLPSLATGWINVLSSGSTTALSGFAIFRTSSNGIPSEGTTPLQTQSQASMDLTFDDTAGFVTDIALANLSSSATTITATVLGVNGNYLGSYSFSMPANGHTAFGFPDKFAVTANQQGLVQFVSSSGNLAGVGLRANSSIPGALTFTSLPVIFP